MLYYDEEIAVCAIEGFAGVHVFAGSEDEVTDSCLHGRISSTSHQMQAMDPVYSLVQVEGIPSNLIRNLL